MIKQNKLPLVAIESINEVHFEEIEIINTLLRQLDDDADFDTLSGSFEKLLEHMQQHFSGEEQLMKESRFPSYRLHKGEHDKTLNEARHIYMDWRTHKERERLLEYFEEDFARWLEQHIRAMDIPMAQFLKDGIIHCSIR